jgi:GT2 family glycosyltransferase
LAALQASAEFADVQLHAVLVDDASSDGTVAAVRARFPWVQVLVGEGNLYWCRGMHRAHAKAPHGHNYYLWLNDDTILTLDAVSRLTSCHEELREQAQPLIVIGSTLGSVSRQTTYGGERRTGWWPTRFSKVIPAAVPMRIDTFDGNIVLLSQAAALRAGNLDPLFEHAMGDLDYGLRANRAGVTTWLAPGWHGVCDDNPDTGTYRDPNLPLGQRWRLMRSRKGLPLRSWLHFNRRHSGLIWPVAFAWPYLRLFAEAVGVGRRRRTV